MMVELVSVLFSEPKIPQLSAARSRRPVGIACFSALQRAENSSIADILAFAQRTWDGFSALQRAENSSIATVITANDQS